MRPAGAPRRENVADCEEQREIEDSGEAVSMLSQPFLPPTKKEVTVESG